MPENMVLFRRPLMFVLVAVVVVFAGFAIYRNCCVSVEPLPPDVEEPPPSTACELKEIDACPGTKWIGIKKSDGDPEYMYPCPPPKDHSPDKWLVTQLFRSIGDTDHDGLDNTPIAEIPFGERRFCLYEWQGPLPPLPELLPLSNELAMLEKDCAVVGPSAILSGDAAFLSYLDQQFYAQAGAATGQAAGPEQVRLVFLDTGPTNASDPHTDAVGSCSLSTADPSFSLPCSPHGHALVNMARGLLCGGAGSAAATTGCGGVTIASRLAMPYVKSGGTLHERTGGGTVGFPSDIARAIDFEVTDWWAQSSAGSPPETRLVLNLSLGWDPCFGGYEVDSVDAKKVDHNKMPARAQAVQAAIQDAVCRGALVVSSGGNFTGLPDKDEANDWMLGPLVPAKWEGLNAPPSAFAGPATEYLTDGAPVTDEPITTSCDKALAWEANGVAGAIPSLSYHATQFLYTVGGLRADDLPLANSRAQGFGELAAFGDHASVSLGPGSGNTAVLTGSSVSAAIVSSTAAAVWSKTTTKTAGDVMTQIEATATKITTMPAGACAGTCDVHKVSLCKAIGMCSPVSTIFAEPTLPLPAPTNLTPPDVAGTLLSADPCRGERWITSGSTTGSCEQWKSTALTATPWGGPQPGDNPCPTCTGKPGSLALLIEMDSNFSIEGIPPGDIEFENVNLLIGPDIPDFDWAGSTETRTYPLEGLLPNPLKPGANAIVCIDDPSPTSALVNAGDAMALSMTTTVGTNTRSILVPVLVLTKASAADDVCTTPSE